MAQKVTVQLVDDLDGGTAESTVEFALDGVSYAIDLSGENAAKLRDAMKAYIQHARRVGGRKKPGPKSGGKPANTTDRARNQKIREWAATNGYTVSDRGRIPAEIVKAYDEAAHG